MLIAPLVAAMPVAQVKSAYELPLPCNCIDVPTVAVPSSPTGIATEVMPLAGPLVAVKVPS